MATLWTVSLGYEMVVLADSETEAEQIALDNVEDSEVTCSSSQPMTYYPPEWTADCLPYTHWGEPEKTIERWIADGAAPDYTRSQIEEAGQMRLPFSTSQF